MGKYTYSNKKAIDFFIFIFYVMDFPLSKRTTEGIFSISSEIYRHKQELPVTVEGSVVISASIWISYWKVLSTLKVFLANIITINKLFSVDIKSIYNKFRIYNYVWYVSNSYSPLKYLNQGQISVIESSKDTDLPSNA